MALVSAPRWWLALGALGNAIVVATWLVSRTVGLPFGQYADEVLPIGFADSVATILGAMIVIGATGLVVRGSGAARAAARVRGFALAAAMVIGALGLVGVLSQTNAFASNGGGGGGQNGPTAPYGGGSQTGNRALRAAPATAATNQVPADEQRTPARGARPIRPSAAGVGRARAHSTGWLILLRSTNEEIEVRCSRWKIAAGIHMSAHRPNVTTVRTTGGAHDWACCPSRARPGSQTQAPRDTRRQARGRQLLRARSFVPRRTRSATAPQV